MAWHQTRPAYRRLPVTLSEFVRAAIPKHERFVTARAISSLVAIAGVVSDVEVSLLRQIKSKLCSEAWNVPHVVRIFCLVTDMNFPVRMKEAARAAEEALHYRPVFPAA
jgi:hypothetical protein